MKKFAKKFALLSMATIMLVGCSSGGGSTTSSSSSGGGSSTSSSSGPSGTSVIALGSVNGIFSPFFVQTTYDRTICDTVHEYLIEIDRQGHIIPNLADYTVEEIVNDAGEIQTVYTFKFFEGITFSDGTPVTADDLIFNYKVYLDPTYDGAWPLAVLPIVGADDYKNGSATEVEGIKKIDDLTVEVTLDGVDPSAIHSLRVAVLPEHYYGEGFVKGDLSTVKDKTGSPMGAGAYVFESFENNIINLAANENYYFGTPEIAKIKFQVIDSANMFEAVRSGTIDIADPSATPEMVAMVEEAGLHYELVTHNAYGYIGLNAEHIPDVDVRKGLMYLMNRGPAIESYYGPHATVIERPMSQVSWAYPQDAEEIYGYSKEKALEHFLAAGYEQINGQLVKDGEQLKIEVGISGNGIMDHPVAPILTQMKVDLEDLGGSMEIFDTDSSLFFDKLASKEWQMWTASWTGSADPDMYRFYHTEGSSDRHELKDPELDAILEAARNTLDTDELLDLYHAALEYVVEEAIVMPVYQRQNMYIFNPEMIDIDSLPDDMTSFYLFYDELHNLKMK
ncbi:MAG: hypothetical protein ATN35_00835 [Epulopiscium sp. Nele67-Bin004]|nr:MAG: hypothetical protein ATN35_00835 [Epulopiscium sp. Nele67-Bin004]